MKKILAMLLLCGISTAFICETEEYPDDAFAAGYRAGLKDGVEAASEDDEV